MSRENLEIVRLAYEDAYIRRSVEGLRERFAEDFRWHSRPEFPGRALYSLDEMPQLWADLDDTYTEFSLVPEEFVEVGDDHVLVTVRQSARMKGSDARVEGTIYHAWHVRDGKPREAWAFSDQREALEAVELREQAGGGRAP